MQVKFTLLKLKNNILTYNQKKLDNSFECISVKCNIYKIIDC